MECDAADVGVSAERAGVDRGQGVGAAVAGGGVEGLRVGRTAGRGAVCRVPSGMQLLTLMPAEPPLVAYPTFSGRSHVWVPLSSAVCVTGVAVNGAPRLRTVTVFSVEAVCCCWCLSPRALR